VADWSDFVGLTVDEAKAKAAKYGIKAVRVVSQDGEFAIGTSDYRTDRLNVETRAHEGVQRIVSKPHTG
jgi:hypothetical protein